MTQMPSTDPAWRELPNDYLARRPAAYACPERPLSVYVTMRDGCRLAVDAYVPQASGADAPQRWPTILILTPYYRRFAVTSSVFVTGLLFEVVIESEERLM